MNERLSLLIILSILIIAFGLPVDRLQIRLDPTKLTPLLQLPRAGSCIFGFILHNAEIAGIAQNKENNGKQKEKGMDRMFVICTYSDTGESEAMFAGTKEEAGTFFAERKESETNVKNATETQYEVWVDSHYKNEMKPGVAYTVKCVDTLPADLLPGSCVSNK